MEYDEKGGGICGIRKMPMLHRPLTERMWDVEVNSIANILLNG